MLSAEAKFLKISAIFFRLACLAEVILPRLYISFPPSFARTFWSRERRLGTRQNGLNEIPEVRFEFPFIFIDQSTMALLRANHGAYPNPDTQERKGGGGGGGGRKRLSAPFRRRSSPEFSFVCGTGFFSSAKTADQTQSPPQGFSAAVPISGDSLYYWRHFTVYRNEPVHFGLIRKEEMFWTNDNVRHVALLFVKY